MMNEKKQKLFLSFVIPDPSYQRVIVELNMHHRQVNGYAQYSPLTSYTDVCRAFFSLEDALLWQKVSAEMPEPLKIVQFSRDLLTKQNRLFEASQANILALLLAKNQEELLYKLRVLYSDAV